uniref:Uncharacterized protein n=1 Tax=Acrobeloides nanus TaxID=290746 RepID=A0A914CMA1_9BILA
MIYGHRKKKAWAYIPTIIVEGIRTNILLIIVIILYLSIFSEDFSTSKAEAHLDLAYFLSVYLIFPVFILIFTNRAYQYMREITVRPSVNVNIEEAERLSVN